MRSGNWRRWGRWSFPSGSSYKCQWRLKGLEYVPEVDGKTGESERGKEVFDLVLALFLEDTPLQGHDGDGAVIGVDQPPVSIHRLHASHRCPA